jgi:hypothetical protein
MHRIGPVWRLANNHFSCGSAAQSIDGAPGRRRANGWRTVPGLDTAISVSHIAARGHRDPRQPQQPQGGGSEGSHHCGAGYAALSAAVFARPEPHRKVFRQTQSAASSSRRAQRQFPLGENRSSAQHCLLDRVHSLFRFFGICVHLNQKCSKPRPFENREGTGTRKFKGWRTRLISSQSNAGFEIKNSALVKGQGRGTQTPVSYVEVDLSE